MIRTIFALSTAPARAALAVIRVSGPEATASFRLVNVPPKPRQANYRLVTDPETQQAVDRAVVLFFPKPQSFTMEDTVEFQVHGSMAVTKRMLSLLGKIPNLHPAEPVNCRLDSLQVEGLSDLLRAETDWQLTQAMSHMEGKAGQKYDQWRLQLIRTLALCEACIDFEEPDEDKNLEHRISREIQGLLDEMNSHLASAYLAKPLAVALLGPPNSGKSSLLNKFANEEIAIVAPTPGTTRDINRATLEIAGLPVTFYDTAGLRSTEDPVELEGQRRALQTQDSALLRLCILDASLSDLHSNHYYLWPSDLHIVKPDLVLINKVDLVYREQVDWVKHKDGMVPCLHTSCATGTGIKEVVTWIGARLQSERPPEGTVLITRERHKVHVTECVKHLTYALSPHLSFDMKSEELREAVNCIGRVAGRVDVEEVLDQVFKEFCIGK